MLEKLIIPEPMLPKQIPGYGLPDQVEHLLNWSFVAEQMSAARYYWISTINRKNAPHVVPVWGVWYENRVILEGSLQTAWVSNAMRNPNVSVHLPDAEQVVIIEGVVQFLEEDDPSPVIRQTIDRLYQSKYQEQHGSPWVLIHPRKVLAWNHPDLHAMTCWNFS